MGYYTNYHITSIEDPNNEFNSFLQELADIVNEDELAYGSYYGKWYDWQEDTLKVSKNHPNLFFLIEGDGEESEDLWRFYCQGEKSCFQEITWPEFKKEYLK